MATGKLLTVTRNCTVINLSELPPSCYTDGSLCGYFLTEFCPLKEWLDDFYGDFGIACSFCPVKLLSEEGATYG